ncbi:hypothetical protein [Streptomyces sp. NPDC058252]|uniref:hypothetical protein n=1 Tax=Streptomyces sp. NPDC058252 TaxID=3346405 RepID=UPI0036E6C544
MTTIAEALGINWAPVTEQPTYRLTYHAQKQAAAKGWTSEDILLAAEQPLHTYPSGRVPGQVRHVRGDLVVIVDPAARRVVTVYRDVVETDVRTDQTDADARRYDSRRTTRLGQRVLAHVDEITY